MSLNRRCLSSLIITVTFPLNVIGALAAFALATFAVVIRQCNWIVEAVNHTTSTLLDPTMIEFQNGEIFTLDIVSTRDVCPKCMVFF